MPNVASFRQSIAARLVLLVAVVAAPLVGVQFYNAFAEAESARVEALEQSALAAQTVLGRIEQQVRTIDSLLLALATTMPLDNRDIDHGNATLRRIKAGLPDYIGSISLIETNGTMLYSAEPEPPAYGTINVSDRNYFKEAIAGNTLAVGRPIVSRTSGKWIVVFARAIRDEPGSPVRGVVTMSILLEHFQDDFTKVPLPRGTLISVVDNNGIVVARSIRPEQWIGKDLSGVPEVQKSLQVRSSVRELTTVDHVDRMAATVMSERLPWLVLVGIPADASLASSRAHLRSVILLTAIITLLTVGIAAWLSRGIAAPLRRLAHDAAKLAGGELGHRSTVTASGEVGALAANFNVMAQELERRNENLRATFEQAAVGLARVAADGGWLQVNQRLCDMLGMDQHALLARPLHSLVCAEDAGKDSDSARLLRDGDIPTYAVEQRLLRADGGCIWANLTVSPVRVSGEPDHLLYVIEDIDERKKSEALVAGQKQVLEMIARGAELSDTLDTLLRAIEAQAPGMLCSILLLDADGVHLHHGSGPSLPEEYRLAIDGEPIGAAAGSCGTAAWRRQPVYVEDIATDPLWANYRAHALRHGLRACWSTPIFDAGHRLLGTFAIYYNTPCLPGRRHKELIEVATQTAAIAISRLETEKALRNERALLEQVTRCSPIGIFAMRMDGSFSLINQAALDIVGETRDTIMRRAYYSPEWRIADVAGHPLQPEQFPFARVKLSGEALFDGEYSMLRPDGRRVQLSVNAAPLRNTQGMMEGVVFAMQDITERRRVLETLRASEEKFAVAFRASPDAIIISDLDDGRFIDINEAGLRLTGYAREELIGRRADEFTFFENPEDRARMARAVRERGSIGGMEAAFRTRQGTSRIGLVAGERIELDGRAHVLSVIRDITEQKCAEQEILKLNAELELRVMERTAQLAAANKELEAFSYSVSHDLKAPLRGIDGYSQLLEETASTRLDEEARLFLRNIRGGVAQMNALIADLLAYARMERRNLDNAVIDLRTCVDAVLQSYRNAPQNAGIVLRCELPPLAVRGDRDGLAIILRNLLDNAIKFSRNAPAPAIEAGAREDNGKVVLWVRDNGIGFDMKFHERIFDIFSRLHRPEDYPGTGVGLALVRKAAQRMGGKVWAESAPGQGATFYLELMHG
ncbi:PAS domain S-box protein [Noviherbaspirillum denitrificans]|uniref:histidine kinase n=1 Tax=Noviherbaspirillum denitrificans TaxID=1968433 RepID=A0A254TFP1_9BURK|nr:PAS domain S-box protein [Noviherbaspirillum denitrificans]OWW21440.1 hypothetical protein AYR66_20065 [Noviherbaspirillum denitrificans]